MRETQRQRRSSARDKRVSTLIGIDSLIDTSDLEELLLTLRSWLLGSPPDSESPAKEPFNKLLLVSGLVGLAALSLFFSSIVLLIPLLHGLGGPLLHKKEGWAFFQPGLGGVRFVALNGVAWTFYAVTLVLHVAHLALGDTTLYLSALLSGLFSLCFMVSSLFAFQGDDSRTVQEARRASSVEEYEEELRLAGGPAILNSRLQRSALLRSSSGENPSGLFWAFLCLQAAGAFCAAWLLAVLSPRPAGPAKTLAALLATCVIAGVVPVTHAIGGRWKNIRTSYAAFQPGRGGPAFVCAQAAGWASYAAALLLALSPPSLATAISGLAAEGLILASLFLFHEEEDADAGRQRGELSTVDRWMEILLERAFGVANVVFGPGGGFDLDRDTRCPALTGVDDHLRGEERWQASVRHIPATHQSYLIVGCGFVGKRLVHRLLQRGERRIKVFDLSPQNPFSGTDEVEFIQGDVTRLEEIQAACVGVDVVYATFALIRFMDRLEHQARVSFHVNVTGTKVLFEAMRREGVRRVVVTSSSHATTDERSEPRFGRDEHAPYVTRHTAHNHYGWTKALADAFALGMNGADLGDDGDGGKMQVVVIRPCSGVFGGDDRTSLEKCVDLGVAPGIGAFCVMDWVYVENVVLGHLLAEHRLQLDDGNVAGEAFNISNNDPTTWVDFWQLVKKTCAMTRPEVAERVKIDFCFVPMGLIWAVAYVSEMNQRLFKGRVSLGGDVDMLTPAMLSTSCMSYSYHSEKARKYLGYEPAYTLDEGVQKSIYEYYKIKYEKQKLF